MAFDAARRPRLARAARYLRARWVIMGGALESLAALDASDLDRCEATLGMISRLHASPADEERALDALAEYTVTYLREQVAFAQSGRYSRTSFEEAARDVYDNAELMSGTYLPGLYLTQAFWPVHVRIGRLFEEHFLSRLPDRGVALEVGTGHGWSFCRMLLARPHLRGVGFDYSPTSLDFTRGLLLANGIGEHRFFLHRADVLEGLGFPEGAASCAVMGEVLEHVEAPEAAAREIRRCLAPQALAFITTAIDSPAIDHISNWPSAEAVDRLLEDAGLAVESRFLLRPADFVRRPSRHTDTTKNYVAVVRPTG